MDIADQLRNAAIIVTDPTGDDAEVLELLHLGHLRFEMFQRIKALNEDEIAVLAEVLHFALEGLEKGRHRYGPLILEHDRRDFLHEAREELRDGGIYLAAAKLKAGKNK